MLSSGVTAQATSGDSAVTVIAASQTILRYVTFINEGAAAGFGSVDGGNTWVRIPAAAAATSPVSVTINLSNQSKKNAGIQIKRVASGSDMSAVYVFAT
jgi:hypothetical protein